MVRALYRATPPRETVRRKKLEWVGRDLTRALELADVIDPFTMARDVVGAAARACRLRR